MTVHAIDTAPPPPALEARIARTQAELEAIVAVRARVFRDEQHIVDNELTDAEDRTSVHAFVAVGGQIIAVGRLAPPTAARAEGLIAWVATLPGYRRRGAANAVMRALLAVADERRMPAVLLSAQTHAMAIYSDLGFTPYGAGFLVRGIPHRYMERRRRATSDE